MGQQEITPEQWLTAVQGTDENPAVRELARRTASRMRSDRLMADQWKSSYMTMADGLDALCPCETNPATSEGPRQECPIHGDGKTFVNQVRDFHMVWLRAVHMRDNNPPGSAAHMVARLILGEITGPRDD